VQAPEPRPGRRAEDLQPEPDRYGCDLVRIPVSEIAFGDNLEEALEAGGHDHRQEPTGARANVLEGMGLVARQQTPANLTGIIHSFRRATTKLGTVALHGMPSS
jgi:hypothetical protein